MAKGRIAAVVGLVLVGSLAGAADTHTLSGTLNRDGVEDGTRGYLKLVVQGESCTDPGPGAHATMAEFADGKATYSIDGVAGGTYTACAFIDVNAREGQVTADSGDYGAMRPVTIEDDATLDFADGDWMAIP